MDDDLQLRQKLARVETLIQEAKKLEDPGLRARVQELVQHLLDFHGAGLARMVDQVRQMGEPGRVLLKGWARDELTASLLLLYGLHPVAMEDRVREALERAGPDLRGYGVEVELLGIEEGVVRLRIENTCNGHASSPIAVRRRITKAIYDAAPDAAGIAADGAAPEPKIEFVPLAQLKAVS